MNSEYTIIVPDADVLSCVCGTNDSNLKLIEEHLGVPVFTKGNELSVDNDDPAIQQQFRFIIDRIIDEVSEGEKNTTDIITSVLNMERHANMEQVQSEKFIHIHNIKQII